MNWTLGLVCVVAMIAGVNVSRESLRSVTPTVSYNAAVGVAYGIGAIVNRVRFR